VVQARKNNRAKAAELDAFTIGERSGSIERLIVLLEVSRARPEATTKAKQRHSERSEVSGKLPGTRHLSRHPWQIADAISFEEAELGTSLSSETLAQHAILAVLTEEKAK
jgi:hypothetical protein